MAQTSTTFNLPNYFSPTFNSCIGAPLDTIYKYVKKEKIQKVIEQNSENQLMFATLLKINHFLNTHKIHQGESVFFKKGPCTHGFAFKAEAIGIQIFIDHEDHSAAEVKVIANCNCKKVQPAIWLNRLLPCVSLTAHQDKEGELQREHDLIRFVLKKNPLVIPEYLALIFIPHDHKGFKLRAYQEQLFEIDEITSASPKIKWKLAKDFVKSLSNLHSQGFVHCDLKYENLFATRDLKHGSIESIKGLIGDLGSLVKIGEPVFCRTPEFISPEQVQPCSDEGLDTSEEDEEGFSQSDSGKRLKKEFPLKANFLALPSIDLYTMGINFVYFAVGLDQFDPQHCFYEIDDQSIQFFLNLHIRETQKKLLLSKEAKKVNAALLELAKDLLVRNKRLSARDLLKKMKDYNFN